MSPHPRASWPRLAGVLAILLLAGCATLPGARPLEKGQTDVGLTFGGPLFSNIGATIPMPMANLQARHGIATVALRPVELNYGLNLTPLAFGVFQGHVGAGYLIAKPNRLIPAIAVVNRIYFGSNFLDPEPASDVPVGVWGMDQIEVAASWATGDYDYIWVSVSEYLDFGAPSLILAPAVGWWVDPGYIGGLNFGAELRWYGLNRRAEVDTVKWWPGGAAPLGISFGVSYAFR